MDMQLQENGGGANPARQAQRWRLFFSAIASTVSNPACPSLYRQSIKTRSRKKIPQLRFRKSQPGA
jgi:hypothetical protein